MMRDLPTVTASLPVVPGAWPRATDVAKIKTATKRLYISFLRSTDLGSYDDTRPLVLDFEDFLSLSQVLRDQFGLVDHTVDLGVDFRQMLLQL